MSEKAALANAPPMGTEAFGPPPPPYSAYPPGTNPQDPSLYPSIGFQPSANEDAKTMVSPQQQQMQQQQMQQQQMQQQQPQVLQPIVQQVIQVPPSLTVLGPNSVRVKCPHCQADVNTTVERDPSIAAYVTAGILFLVGCVCGCCLLPFCMDSCKTSEHYCANCKKFIGRYSKY